jgi:expansin
MRLPVCLLAVALASTTACDRGDDPERDDPSGDACYDGAPVAGTATTYGPQLAASACFAQAGALESMSGEGQAAVRFEELGGSAACGACLEVAGPAATRVVRAIEGCIGCVAGDLMDLDEDTFAAIGGGAADGRISVTARAVACPGSGPLAYASSAGTNPYFVELWVLDHRHVLANVELRVAGAWQPMTHTDINGWRWTSAGATVESPYALRITDVFDHVVEDTVSVAAGEVGAGGAQLPACG